MIGYLLGVELPVHDDNSEVSRPIDDVRAMAVAVQANLVQLKIAECKRLGAPTFQHAIDVQSPGAVRRFRETLIHLEFLKTAPATHIHFRLREIWGQYSLMRWAFAVDSKESADFSTLSAESEVRCRAVLEAKHAELHALLWALRFEQRLRSAPSASKTELSEEDRELAKRIPADAFGTPVAQCPDDELVLAACEHAGMLAALRWIMDARREWGEAGIMDVGERPF
ncbi:MAG: hypothetical protein IIC02_02450 [Planctomycetes bacterium]|nr:hypothetical protein [Planctomycetota bacterium]